MDNLYDCYYFPMSSQGNIYTLLELPVINGFSRVLFSSLKREIYCFEYHDTPLGLTPRVKEIPFNNIPSGAEVVSMCAFNKSSTKNDFIIGITLCKYNTEQKTSETFLNIYSEWEENDCFDLEKIAQNCSVIDLNYMPYHLYHTYLVIWENERIKQKEHVLLLSGDDNHVHLYRENTTDHSYKEHDYKEFFPELNKTTSHVMKMSVYYNEDCTFRVVAISTEEGYIRLTKTETKINKVHFSFCTRFNNVTPSIELYEEFEYPKSFTEKHRFNDFKLKKNRGKVKLNMVVVNSLLPSVIFQDILTYGLSKYACLPRLEDDNNVLTDVQCVDIDFDGTREVLIGSCNRSLSMYKIDHKGVWFLEQVRMLPSPVLTHLYCDINGDGVKELMILTLKGLIFLEHDHENLNKILDARIKHLCSLPRSGRR